MDAMAWWRGAGRTIPWGRWGNEVAACEFRRVATSAGRRSVSRHCTGMGCGISTSSPINAALGSSGGHHPLPRPQQELLHTFHNDAAAVALVDAAGEHVIVYTTPSYQRLVPGGSGAVGKPWLDTVHPDDHGHARALAAAVRKQPHVPHSITYRRVAAGSGGAGDTASMVLVALGIVGATGHTEKLLLREVPTASLSATGLRWEDAGLVGAVGGGGGGDAAGQKPGSHPAGVVPVPSAATYNTRVMPIVPKVASGGVEDGGAGGSGVPLVVAGAGGFAGIPRPPTTPLPAAGGGDVRAGSGGPSVAGVGSGVTHGPGTRTGSSGEAGMVGHDRLLRYAVNELYNAMHALNASATSIMDAMDEVSPETAQDLSDVVFAAYSTQVLVSEMLTLSRVKDGTMTLSPEVVPLRALLKEAVARVRPVYRAPITIRVSTQLPALIVLDPALLTQLLSNALALAVRHGEGSDIHLVAYRSDRPPPMGPDGTRPHGGSLSPGPEGMVSPGGGAPFHAAAPRPDGQPESGDAVSLSSSADRYLTVELMDQGSGMCGSSGATLMDALVKADVKTVKGARAQRLALMLPIARMVTEMMNGYVGVQEKRVTAQGAGLAGGMGMATTAATTVSAPPSPPAAVTQSVVRFAFTVPYTEPSDAEARRAREEMGFGLPEGGSEECEGIVVNEPLPLPFGAVTHASEFRYVLPSGAEEEGPPPYSVMVVDAATGAGDRVLAARGSNGGRSSGSKAGMTLAAPRLADVDSSASPTLTPMAVGGVGRYDAAGPTLGMGGGVEGGASVVGAGAGAGGAGIAVGGGGGPGSRRRHVAPVGLDGKLLNMHVLLVDDVRVIRRQGEAFLEQLGCTCVTLEDGDQVDQALAQTMRPFDAIVMDIVMHRSDGATVCRNLREKYGIRCPIIAMTGNTQTRDMQRYYAMGFDVVLPKPFTRDAIGRALVEGRERRGGNTRFARMEARVFDPTPGGRLVGGASSSGMASPSVESAPSGLHAPEPHAVRLASFKEESEGETGGMWMSPSSPSISSHATSTHARGDATAAGDGRTSVTGVTLSIRGSSDGMELGAGAGSASSMLPGAAAEG